MVQQSLGPPTSNGVPGNPDNGAAGDPDMDGSPNSREQEQNSDPTDDDSGLTPK